LIDRVNTLVGQLRLQFRIIYALLLRELATRYGRDNIGFLWLVGEPLLFSFGVMVMWSIIRPPYDHGIAVIPFVVTGYLPLTLLRHNLTQGINCIKVNSNLLYHRQITLLHLFIARAILELAGISLAFFIVVATMIPFGLMDPPKSWSMLYAGWFLLDWIVFGMALIFGSLAQFSEVVERAMNLATYVMIPLSGTFYMIAWLPYRYRAEVMKIPLVNCEEMIRSAFFGEFYPTYYDVGYAVAWALGFTFFGLILLALARRRVEID
jgi:capsular polysaccharide transport system permease protein